MRKLLLLLLLTTASTYAKEIFTSETIFDFLNDSNPHVILTKQEELIAKQHALFALGPFDLGLHGKVEDKEYAISKGEFEQAGVTKKLYNGIELKTDYRKSQGTQEYNNIKTSKEGEMLFSVKLPILELLMQSNTDRLTADLAQMQAQTSTFGTTQKLQQILYASFNAYYALLGAKAYLEIDERFLERAKTQKNFIQTKINEGQLASIALVEQDTIILDAQKRAVSTREQYENALETFLYYLNISRDDFFDRFVLPAVGDKTQTTIPTLEASLEIAKENRPDLKILQIQKEQLLAQKQNAKLMRYPTLNLGAIGNYDFLYKEGYKLSLDLSYALGQSQAKAKNSEIQTKLLALETQWKQKLRFIQTDLIKILNSLSSTGEKLQYTFEKAALSQTLRNAEEKRFALGSSDLLTLNAREMQLLNAQKEFKQHQIEMLLLQESYKLKTFLKKYDF